MAHGVVVVYISVIDGQHIFTTSLCHNSDFYATATAVLLLLLLIALCCLTHQKMCVNEMGIVKCSVP